jgi:hypothetical protein
MPDNEPTAEEIEQQWQEWSKRHPNPSGLPDAGALTVEFKDPATGVAGTVDIQKVAAPLKAPPPEHHDPLHKLLLDAGLPGVRWVPSPNYTPGRAGHNPNWSTADPATWITLHTMVGTMAGTIAAFQSATRQASSTYAVGLDGSIVQFVHESDAPWTNGTMTGIGSNLDSVTIEGEDGGNYNGPRTPAFYKAEAMLVADIHKRRKIPLIHRATMAGGVLGHKECTNASTACPDSLNINGIVAAAIVIVTPLPPPDIRPEWQKNLVKLTTPQTFKLYKTVSIFQMATGVVLSTVPMGDLLVTHETSSAGVAFWVTDFGATSGNGLKKTDVAVAIVVPIPPPLPIFEAVDPQGLHIYAATDQSKVISAAVDWQQANRGIAVTITKDGVAVQTLPAIAPDPVPVDPVVDKSLMDLLRQLFEALKKLFGGSTPTP